MRLLVPAASAALIAAVALSATAAVAGAGARVSPASPARVSAAQVSAAQVSAARVSAGPPQSAGPALQSAVHGAGTGTGTTTVTGTNATAPRATQVTPSGGFTWPLSPRPAVFRRFEQPLRQWSPGHRGVDLLAGLGQPVLSAGDGIVAFSGVIAGRGVITVRHPGGLRTTFEPVDERSASGTVVHQGTRIGVVSPTPGHCVPRHCLHWGAISGQDYRDPLSLLGFVLPILLPLG